MKKETIELVKKMIEDGNLSQEIAEKYCPELKENDDKRIRKAILKALMTDEAINTLVKCGIYYEDVESWLEKQGEQKPTLPKWKYKNDPTPLLRDSLILNKYGCVAKLPSGAIVSDVWVIDYNELAKLPKEEYEKQGEQKPAEWNREDEQNLNACLGYIPDEYLRRWLTDAIHVKYDKSADKVEPEF